MHTIIIGNEKGGSGKSTVAMHVAVGLLRRGYRVGTIDLDARQGTFTRYFQNRQLSLEALSKTKGFQAESLPMPDHFAIRHSNHESRRQAEADERQALGECLSNLRETSDVVVIDTPGSDYHLSRLAHAEADTLITPINDSYVDLDLLAVLHPETGQIVRPSVYAEMVWQQRQVRAISSKRSALNSTGEKQPNIDWIVLRNRLSHITSKNKEDISGVLETLAKRINFRTVAGFGERVIFRQLFLRGLTMMDLMEIGLGDDTQRLNLSHVAARSEVRVLLDAIKLPPPSTCQKSGLSAVA